MRTYSYRIYAVAGIVVLIGVAAARATAVRPSGSPAFRRVVSADSLSVGALAAAAPVMEQASPLAAPMPTRVANASLERDRAPATSATDSYWSTQKLIRSGELRILVTDVRKAIDVADSIGRRHGALLSGTQASADAQTTHDAQLQFRVPADRFTETVSALRALGDVRAENMSTQDVTKDYADLETRVRVKDETVTRLRALLATHTAKLGEVLQVEQELARAVTELEQLKGARRYYDQQVAMSSLSVSLFEQVVIPPRARFTDPIAAACRHALEVLGSSLAGLVYGVVFILPWTLLAMILWWLFTLLRPRPASSPRSAPGQA